MAESNERGRLGLETSLPFERRILEIEALIEKTPEGDARGELISELERERETVFQNLTAWQRVQLARHALRPRMLDYTRRILEDFFELHGDRLGGDDAAVITGIGRFRGRTLMVVGQQKGVTTEEKVARNFGMPHPEGYRKALRAFRLAERWRLPIVTFVDTPAAHPGIEAEAHGQGPTIAQNLLEMLGVKTPVFAVILGEGGSGGALAIALGDWVAMFEHAIYVICPPERCAEILWKDVEKKELAASALRVTARELLALNTIDAVLPESGGGAHRNPEVAAQAVAEELAWFLGECDKGRWTSEQRREKYQRMGVWSEMPSDEYRVPSSEFRVPSEE
ncbi:MAG: acetyl-CoA carboxylase carboxyltransferase subunit alpha [Candidatus Hydrogenedentes bacterium]|nr:acetyl-CoA carboxylase carboxyltransferase subunit alpha [Candidatus Hydrogenedentota bacterium]